MRTHKICIASAIAFLVLASSRPAAAFTIDLVADPSLQANPAALAGVQEAIRLWEEQLSDPITVTIYVEMFNAPPTTFGGTLPVIVCRPYGDVRDAMIADAGVGEGILNLLPSSVQANVPPDFVLSNTACSTKANLKALGFSGLDTEFGVQDALLIFNRNANFDFDRSDGIVGVDFVGTVSHEIGHALGFLSAVDKIDEQLDPNNPPPSPITIDIRPMDLFRFPDSANPANWVEFSNFARTITPGEDAVFDDTALELALATGFANGDGAQASHWQPNLPGFRLMDWNPVLDQQRDLTEDDLRVFGLIGFDRVDTPLPVPVFSRPLLGVLAFALIAIALVSALRRASGLNERS